MVQRSQEFMTKFNELVKLSGLSGPSAYLSAILEEGSIEEVEREIEKFIWNKALTNNIGSELQAPQENRLELHPMWSEVRKELMAAMGKFPPFNSGHEGYAIIKEELDELWEEVKKKQSTPGRAEAMYKEALQVAAMALRFMVDLPNFKN